jgi:membrane protein YdbS with pleckstrin-like domain
MSFLREIFRRLIGWEIETSVALCKIQSAIVYLNLIKAARRMSMLICLLVFCVVILACGFLLIPIALCLFMPWTSETKAVVAAVFGAAYIVIPLIGVTALFRQKRWIKAAKADKLLKEAFKEWS